MRNFPTWCIVGLLLLMPRAGHPQGGGSLPPVQPPGGGYQPGAPGGGGGAGNGQRRAQVQQIIERYRTQRQQLRGQIQQQRQQLSQMLRSNAPQSQTQARLQAIIGSEGQLENLSLQEYYELSAILPPQARERYTERIAGQVAREHRPGAPPVQGEGATTTTP